MTDKESFVQLVAASLTGQRANPGLEFKGHYSPIRIALQDAQEALAEINELYPTRVDRHTPIEREQKEFAKRVESENGNGKHR